MIGGFGLLSFFEKLEPKAPNLLSVFKKQICAASAITKI